MIRLKHIKTTDTEILSEVKIKIKKMKKKTVYENNLSSIHNRENNTVFSKQNKFLYIIFSYFWLDFQFSFYKWSREDC